MRSFVLVVVFSCISTVLAHGHISPKHGFHKKRVLARQGNRLDKRTAYIKCTSTSTFSLCDDNGSCTDMGSVAAGTACVNGSIGWAGPNVDRTKAEAPAAAPTASASPSTTIDSSAGPTPVANYVNTSTESSDSTVDDCDEDDASSADGQSSSAPTATASSTSSTPASQPQAQLNVEPSSSSSSSSSSSAANPVPTGSSFSGHATFYYQNGVAGACGTVNPDSAKIVALQTTEYGSGSNCGRTVVITNNANGKQVTATVADMCPGCDSSKSLDLSTGAFDAIGNESTGVLDISWYYSS